MTARGELLHDELPLEHPGVQRIFREGLDVDDQGEPIVRIGDMWCYLAVEDCIVRVTALVPGPEGALSLRLDDGRTVPLDPGTLWEEPGRGLRCQVPSRPTGRPLDARFENRAALDLSRWMDLDADPPVLEVGSRRVPIRTSPPAGDPPPES